MGHYSLEHITVQLRRVQCYLRTVQCYLSSHQGLPWATEIRITPVSEIRITPVIRDRDNTSYLPRADWLDWQNSLAKLAVIYPKVTHWPDCQLYTQDNTLARPHSDPLARLAHQTIERPARLQT